MLFLPPLLRLLCRARSCLEVWSAAAWQGWRIEFSETFLQGLDSTSREHLLSGKAWSTSDGKGKEMQKKLTKQLTGKQKSGYFQVGNIGAPSTAPAPPHASTTRAGSRSRRTATSSSPTGRTTRSAASRRAAAS